MTRSIKISTGLACALMLTAVCHQAWSAPSTATFMNVMTVCAAGSTITIDANLQGSMASIYDKESTKGRAVQQIVTEISKILPQGDAYARYLDCVKDLLSRS